MAEPVLYTERFYRDAEHHRVRRPGWTCTACARPWPCMIARLLIRHRMKDFYHLVRAATAGQMRVADSEVDKESAYKLYRRFTVWTHRNLVCGVCGSDRHVALPGVPPRLYGCDGIRALMAGDGS
ncbi:hypothetical protein ACQP2P_41000 [Dactylosporangium sp. CA-139114]|uniref:hypothetical protein n=1 Tax=Dactylosporangium sp. CA-139114 TaxID=3239931 RepID=UPI003D987063